MSILSSAAGVPRRFFPHRPEPGVPERGATAVSGAARRNGPPRLRVGTPLGERGSASATGTGRARLARAGGARPGALPAGASRATRDAA